MKIGVFTVCIPEFTPEEAVATLRSLGYDGVEWRVGKPCPDDKPENYTYENRYWYNNKCTLDIQAIDRSALSVKELCDKAGIEIFSLTTYLQPGDINDIKRVLSAAASMGCGNVRVFAPYYDGSENYHSILDRTRKQIDSLEVLAKMFGVKVVFEQHMKTIIPSASAAYRLVSGFDPKHIGIIFDPGNMVFEGFEDYRMTVDILGPYLAHVHVKNAFWKQDSICKDGTAQWTPDWAPLKEGIADIPMLIQVLKDKCYDGFLCLEDFTNNIDTKTKLEESLAFYKCILES